ncbi:MAG: hypothetical protein EA381_18090, partial [Planctomycetaceae bacterium]
MPIRSARIETKARRDRRPDAPLGTPKLPIQRIFSGCFLILARFSNTLVSDLNRDSRSPHPRIVHPRLRLMAVSFRSFHSMKTNSFAVCTAFVCLATGIGIASAADKRSVQDEPVMEWFEAEKAGQIEVKFLPKDATEATVLVKNLTDAPIRIRLPETFAAVPVNAQMMGGMGMGGMGGGGMGGMGMGGMGGMDGMMG